MRKRRRLSDCRRTNPHLRGCENAGLLRDLLFQCNSQLHRQQQNLFDHLEISKYLHGFAHGGRVVSYQDCDWHRLVCNTRVWRRDPLVFKWQPAHRCFHSCLSQFLKYRVETMHGKYHFDFVSSSSILAGTLYTRLPDATSDH